jgi:hypothetical protein
VSGLAIRHDVEVHSFEIGRRGIAGEWVLAAVDFALAQA